jgi:single-strand DNA-binding protein
VAWDKLAETCNQFLSKGRKVYVEGRLQTRAWEGQDGQQRSRVEVVAQNMVMLDSKGRSDGDEPVGAAVGPRGGVAVAERDDEDLPF